MSFYQQSIYLLLSSYTFTQKYQGYRSILQLKKSYNSSITIFLLYQVFIKRYIHSYSYKENRTASLLLNIVFALISLYTYIEYHVSKNIYCDLQKL